MVKDWGNDLSREDQDFVERRINQLDRRIDTNVGIKLEAMEKLLSLTFATRSDALNISMNRLQQDNTACAARCSTQVKEFYTCFGTVNEKIQANIFSLESIRRDILDDAKDLQNLEEEMNEKNSELRVRIDKIDPKIENILRWKESFLVKNLSITIVTAYGIIHVAFSSMSWLLDYFSKMGVIGAGM